MSGKRIREHAPFGVVGGVSLWYRAFLSRGGGFLSNAHDRAEAGRSNHTPLASEVISFSHESCFEFFFARSKLVFFA